jgi:hypothetical protein
MNELKNLASIMLGKMVIMETLLQKQPKTTEPNLSQVSKVPKKNKASVPKPKNVAKSPKNGIPSKPSSGHNVDNSIMLSSDDDDKFIKKKSKKLSNIQSSCSIDSKVHNRFVMILC